MFVFILIYILIVDIACVIMRTHNFYGWPYWAILGCMAGAYCCGFFVGG